jgi:hypothetical protein
MTTHQNLCLAILFLMELKYQTKILSPKWTCKLLKNDGRLGVDFTNILHKYFCAKKLQSQNLTREKLCKALLYKIFSHKMLMKFLKQIHSVNCFRLSHILKGNTQDCRGHWRRTSHRWARTTAGCPRARRTLTTAKEYE